MDLKNLLGKLDLLEGSMNNAEKNPTGPKFTGQWKGTDKGLPGKKLVGDSIEPQESILKDLSKGPTPKTKEQDLAEQFEEFLQALEEENLGVETKRPARKGSRPGREYTSNEKPSKRYKTIKEDAIGDGEEANAVVAEVMSLISDGHTEVSPDVIIAKVSAALGRPFMLKDLVATNNNSPELQHYIDSINPTKIKFSTDILTVKNQDPMKEKQVAQNGVANMAARAASRPRLGESLEESAESLNVGDDVIITGPVEYEGATGVIDSFGQDNRFVVVNLYNHGKKSFHSSDVSFNEYADSEEEEAELNRYGERDHGLYGDDDRELSEDSELSSQELRDRMSSAMATHDEVTADWGNPGFARHFGKTSLQSALNRKYGILKALKDKSLPLAQRLKFKDLLSNVEREIEDLQMAESQGDPHKILLNKLRDIERKHSVSSADDNAKRAEQAKADYAKYVAKMKKKNPDYVPLYKIDEYGADAPTGTAGQTSLGATQPNQAQQAQQAKNVAQATQTLKAATGTTVPTTNLAKAIDAASQGKAVDATSMKALEPIMKDVASVASDPKLAGQFKSLANQINQAQAKQAQQKI